jgi:nucleoid DNA-binding protein
MKRVTKATLVARLVGQGLTGRQAEQVLGSMLGAIEEALARGEAVSLRGFGRLSTRSRPFHWRQLPNGEIVRVPHRRLVAFRPAAALRAAADTSPDDPYFDAIIARRRRSSRQLLSQPEQDLDLPVFETQFDLGIAYREMGLVDKALDRFHKALGLLDEGERGARFVQCCYLIGLCLRELGNLEFAEHWLREGLAAPRRPRAERLEFHYQLGLLLEWQDREREALAELNRVFISSPSFRDVASRVRALKERLRRRAREAAGSAAPAAPAV